MISCKKNILDKLLAIALLIIASIASAKDEPAPITTSYYELTPAFTINYGGINRTRYIQTSITLKVTDSKTESKVREHDAAIRHTIIMLFSKQTSESLRSVEGRELILEEALIEIQNLLEKETGELLIDRVLFTAFVLQT